MHILVRGDVLQRLRLASGLILFTFAATHFLNHALGLVSLDACTPCRLVARSYALCRTALLLGAFLTHISLALNKIAVRTTWAFAA